MENHVTSKQTAVAVSYYYLMPWYFIPRVLKLATAKMYVRNGYDRDSEIVNVLARHTALKRQIATEIRWYRNVVSRGSAVQSVALLPISAMRL